jgi:hypothetical protein
MVKIGDLRVKHHEVLIEFAQPGFFVLRGRGSLLGQDLGGKDQPLVIFDKGVLDLGHNNLVTSFVEVLVVAGDLLSHEIEGATLHDLEFLLRCYEFFED